MARMNAREREEARKREEEARKKEHEEHDPSIIESLKAGPKRLIGALTSKSEPKSAEAKTNGKNGNGKNGGGKPTSRDPGEYFSGKKFEETQKKAQRESGIED